MSGTAGNRRRDEQGGGLLPPHPRCAGILTCALALIRAARGAVGALGGTSPPVAVVLRTIAA